MKRTFITASGFFLLLVLFAHPGWADQPAPSNKAVFYQGYCGEGSRLELGPGEYPDLRNYTSGLSGGANWNDQITCVAIGSGITKVIVYEHINYEGRSKEFTRSSWGSSGGDWTLDGEWWNDRISSIKVIGTGGSTPWGESAPRNKAVFYQDGCGSGNHLELGVGAYSDLRNYPIGGSGGTTWNDQITCIAIGSGITKVIVYEHPDFKGRSKEFTKSWGDTLGNWNVADDWCNDRISSIKVIGPGYTEPSGGSAPRNKAVFYQDDCGSGNYLELATGTYSDLRNYTIGGSGGTTWNDQITCIAIGSGITKVTVYEHINFGGRSKVFTRSWGGTHDSWSVADDWWNDKISSIKIR
jgi:hypothetical protein